MQADNVPHHVEEILARFTKGWGFLLSKGTLAKARLDLLQLITDVGEASVPEKRDSLPVNPDEATEDQKLKQCIVYGHNKARQHTLDFFGAIKDAS